MADPKTHIGERPAEGIPSGNMRPMSAAQVAARGRRNLAIGFAVVAFIIIVYTTTMLRLTQNIEAGREESAAEAARISAPAGGPTNGQ